MEEKEIRMFEVPFNFNWTYGIELKKLKEDLDVLEKLGVTEIDIEAEEYYRSASVIIKAFTNRLETDEEFNSRINKENARLKIIEQQELAQLERLNKKYKKQ